MFFPGIQRFHGLQSFANRFKLSSIALSRGQTRARGRSGKAAVVKATRLHAEASDPDCRACDEPPVVSCYPLGEERTMAKAAAAAKKPLTKTEMMANIADCDRAVEEGCRCRPGGPRRRNPEEPEQQGRRRDHHPRTGEDREEEGPRQARPEERAQSLQAGRVPRHCRQAGLEQGQGSRTEDAEGLGQVILVAPTG